ncbi:hypothetical protein A2870_04105 [Candidatus Curtissbacteria bacterium RIFCSPHIGHO2_01_FULL_41_11]|uniref:Uncharacterized protein n=1 Tax=Candidatus Curtissbacteria bacterium RIFCSPHIGHO2_01_FULL_41_11 TaxID=1797711 RepID=A0A1F5G6Q7_9BACT|nr:MAG: hypothetical protein A2870_04105 [Candidatus Curtissbacteria bacterium RIFCSPHIGHO2_01_FULL_41_11]
MFPRSSKNFLIKFPKSKTRNVTIVVKKAIAKNAVDRNRIKRITREALKKIGDLETGIVLIPKNNIAKLKTQEVYEELRKIIKK